MLTAVGSANEVEASRIASRFSAKPVPDSVFAQRSCMGCANEGYLRDTPPFQPVTLSTQPRRIGLADSENNEKYHPGRGVGQTSDRGL